MLTSGDLPMNRHTWKPYLGWIVLGEAVGALSGWLIRHDTALYAQSILKPPLSPPSVVFPVVWSALFALMGVGAARVWLTPPSPARTRALTVFGVQLAFNFCWSLIFFNAQAYGFALVWLAALWGLILAMLLLFRACDKPAAWLQLPYLLWVSFAAYLNFGVWALN